MKVKKTKNEQSRPNEVGLSDKQGWGEVSGSALGP